jgi:hypothetical protein
MVNRRLPNTAKRQSLLARLPYLADQMSDIHNACNERWIVSWDDFCQAFGLSGIAEEADATA